MATEPKSYTMNIGGTSDFEKLSSYIAKNNAKLQSFQNYTSTNLTARRRSERTSYILELIFSDHVMLARFSDREEMSVFIKSNPELNRFKAKTNEEVSANTAYPNALINENDSGYWRLNVRLDIATWNKIKGQFRFLTRELIEDGCADYGCRPGYYLKPNADYTFVSAALGFVFPETEKE